MDQTSKTEAEVETMTDTTSFDVHSVIMIFHTLSFSFDRKKGRVNHRGRAEILCEAEGKVTALFIVDQQR